MYLKLIFLSMLEYPNTRFVREPVFCRSTENAWPLPPTSETTDAVPLPWKPTSGFIQNMSVPPLISSKYLRAGIRAEELETERYSAALCE